MPIQTNKNLQATDAIYAKCARCGSTDVRPKGYANTKRLGIVRVLRCRACKYRFRSKTVGGHRLVNLPQSIVEKYFESTSVKNLRDMLNLDRSEKTVHRWMTNQLRNQITWEDFLPELAERVEFSHIMGLDTTVIWIAGKRYYYLHVVDFPDNHLAFEVLETEDAESIKRVLQQIKVSADYVPTVTVIDMANELLGSVKDVYPTSVIQGCLFHLRSWLDKRLPSKRLSDPIRAQNWDALKSLIMAVALARDREEQEKYLDELRHKLFFPTIEQNGRKVIKDFLKNSKYYHTLNELTLFGCKPEWRYNNLCERAIRSVKELSGKMYGFKNLELTTKYINAMWITNMRKKIEAKSENLSERNNAATYSLPLDLFTYGKYIDLEEAARAYNVKTELLKSEVEKMGYAVTGNIAFSKDYLNIILQEIQSKQPKTLYDLMKITNLSCHHSIDIIRAIGLKIKYSSLDPQGMLIRYEPGHE